MFIRTVSSLDKAVSAALSKEKEKDPKKKMDAAKARALNGMKQKVKKTAKEYETQLKEFEADPEAFEAAYQATVAPEVVQPRERPTVVRTGSDDEGGADGAPAGTDFTTVGKGGKQYEFTKDSIFKTLKAVQEARGKKVRRCSGS